MLDPRNDKAVGYALVDFWLHLKTKDQVAEGALPFYQIKGTFPIHKLGTNKYVAAADRSSAPKQKIGDLELEITCEYQQELV